MTPTINIAGGGGRSLWRPAQPMRLLFSLVVRWLHKRPAATGAVRRRQGLAARRIRLLACPSAARPDLLIDARTRRWSTGRQGGCLSQLFTSFCSVSRHMPLCLSGMLLISAIISGSPLRVYRCTRRPRVPQDVVDILSIALVTGGLDQCPTPTWAADRRQRLAARGICLLTRSSATRPDLFIDARTRRCRARRHMNLQL
jgi:hypothetical protein